MPHSCGNVGTGGLLAGKIEGTRDPSAGSRQAQGVWGTQASGTHSSPSWAFFPPVPAPSSLRCSLGCPFGLAEMKDGVERQGPPEGGLDKRGDLQAPSR